MSEYVLTDGKSFIFRNHSNRFVPTNSESLADVMSKKQAEGILHNSLPKNLRARFYLKEHNPPTKEEQKIVKRVTDNDLKENTEKVMVSDNIQKWLDKVADLNGLSKDAKKRKEELTEQLSKLDTELCDIEHWIEFSKFNASQGYKASKELQNCRIKRRSVKNELFVVNLILNQQVSDVVADEILTRVSGMDHRTYNPRIRTDLFDL